MHESNEFLRTLSLLQIHSSIYKSERESRLHLQEVLLQEQNIANIYNRVILIYNRVLLLLLYLQIKMA